MGILGRTIFLEIATSAFLGTLLFTFVLFLRTVSSKLFEMLVRSSAGFETVMYLFALVLPQVLTFTIPVGVLIGTLVALSRMSSDAEITAMRAAGIPSRVVLIPVVAFAILGVIATACTSLWLTPVSVRETYRVLNRLAAAQLTADIQARVFEEQFPNRILYVGDVIPGPVMQWRNVFIADITPPDQRQPGPNEAGDGPLITTAAEAIAVPDVARNNIQLSLVNGSTHQAGKQWTQYYSTRFPRLDQVLEAQKPGELKPRVSYIGMDTQPLRQAASESTEANIELHQRLALPPACLVLALIGIALGVSSRKSGKSSALVITVLIAFIYWMGLISLIGLARRGALPVEVALWLPNAVVGLVAVVLLMRLERPGDRDFVGSARRLIVDAFLKVQGSFPGSDTPRRTLPVISGMSSRFWLIPQIVDRYVLSTFLFYFLLLLVSFILMTHVFTFFELLSDIVKNKIPLSVVGRYLVFLTPLLIYQIVPISVLVAVLVTFGVLVKNNEVTAFKASGISLYRLAIPLLLFGVFLSGALFAFDYYILPQANRIQDALRSQIKAGRAQTFFSPGRRWIFGEGSRIYDYRYLDPTQGVMDGVSVYELEPVTFKLRRHITAERARWEPNLNTWIFQNGWARDVRESREAGFYPFQGQTATFPELQEPPTYFAREVLLDKQMNFQQLASYIRELRQSGSNTVRLQVQYHKKFAFPLFAFIMALIAVPFAFLAGPRGAMASIGVSFGLAIAYWGVSQLFEQIGYVDELPAPIAAWSPDVVFSLTGLYLLARMKT